MPEMDDNGNYLPSIYTRNTTNSPFHLQQVAANLMATPFPQVQLSAYFDKDLQDNSWNKFNLETRILPVVEYQATLSPGSNVTSPNHQIVFVYDIEEITMLSHSHRVQLQTLLSDINWWEIYYTVGHIVVGLKFVDSEDNILPEPVDNIEDIFNGETDELKQMVPRYTALKKFYNEVSKKFDRKKSIISDEIFKTFEIADTERIEMCHVAKQLQKVYNNRWKTVDKCLKLVKKRSENSKKKYANVVLTEREIVHGVSELLVSGHGSTVEIENVFSIRNVSQASIFEKIQTRFGQNCTLIYVTSFPNRASIPGWLNIPIWHVTSNESLEMLYKAERDFLLR